ncbi:MAG: DUF2279 domain-containing protein [Chitinophagales bacterium]|nr:DUF2279 domain-containing protein [Chitinophagales bacterium]
MRLDIKSFSLISFFCLLSNFVAAQNSVLDPADSLVPGRVVWVASTISSAFVGSMVGLNYLWYKEYPRSPFHFFNDNKEWLQIDKVGHMQTAYFQSYWSMKALQWAGIEKKKAAYHGAAMGFFFQSTIEMLDGLSSEWGASPGDILANGVGSMAMLSQELLWEEQKMIFKFSMHDVEYPEGMYRERAKQLFGDKFIHRMLKDYNGQVYWASLNLSSVFPGQQKFKWLNIAVGYGAGDMYGGFKNEWVRDDELKIVYPAERYRKFFLSIDADLSRIPLKRKGYKPLLYMLNIIKIPAPALEFNTKGQIIFHPVYFLSLDFPITIKK